MIERKCLLAELPEKPVGCSGGGSGKGGLIMKTIISTIFLALATVSPAFAVDTTVVYKSGILVSVFVGFLALIVVVQLVPALMLLLGFIKSLVPGRKKESAAVESTVNGD